MKKIISLILLAFIPSLVFAWAPLMENMSTEASDVIATIDSWKYDSVIKVKLIPNDDWAKIFYYTDQVWRFDQQIEYKQWSEIIIKKDTILNYHSSSANYTASLIKENKYIFNYPQSLEIFYENNKISIKNNENKEVNLWYWTIWNFEIPENTIISPSDTYIYNYTLKNNEKINLVSPDEKVKKEFINVVKEEKVISKNTIRKDTINRVSTEQDKNEINQNETNVETEFILSNENSQNTNTAKTEESTNNTELNSAKQENIQVQETPENTNLANNLKSSVIDNKSSKNNIFIVLVILFFIIWMIAWIFYKKEKRSA